MGSWHLLRWIRSASSKVSHRRPPTRLPRIRLSVEVLEPRLAPATFTVTDNSDSATDTGSLRYALANFADGNTIDFAPSVRDIVLTSDTTLQVGTNVNIVNDLGTGTVTIDGNNAATVFAVFGTASLSGLTITNGVGAGPYFYAGGIENYGALTVSDCTFSANTGDGGGGGIENLQGSTLTVSDCIFSGNSAGAFASGGGISNGGTAAVTNSTFSDNVGAAGGGGIFGGTALTVNNSTFVGNVGGGIGGATLLTVTNSTFADNTSEIGGAGVLNFNNATVNDCTFTGNTVSNNFMGGGGAGVLNSGGTLALNGDILVGNTTVGVADDVNNAASPPAEKVGTISGVDNVVGSDNSASFANGVNGNQVGVTTAQVALAPLADNGGPTQTIALMPGSVAIGMGQAGVDPTDQRGDPRPATARADAGAFQTQGIVPPPSVSVAFGPAGEVLELVNSEGVLTQFTSAGAQVFGGGVADASVAFHAGSEVLLLTYTNGALYQFDAAGAHQLGAAGAQSASVAFGPGGEVVEMVNTAGVLTQFSAAGAIQLGGGVSSASVAFVGKIQVFEVVSSSGVLTQFINGVPQQLGHGVQSVGVAFAGNSLALDIIFSDGALDQFSANGELMLGIVS